MIFLPCKVFKTYNSKNSRILYFHFCIYNEILHMQMTVMLV
uniref:Uncharacterized protein n=1 Tax=Anguilla anguilla TaxID=7936 RepID=A0A0E9RZF6_ANGAN